MKRTSKKSTGSSPENGVPEREEPRKVLGPVLYLCGALLLLGIGVHAIVTGKPLLIGGKSGATHVWSEFIAAIFFSVYLFSWALEGYRPELKRRFGAFISDPLFFCGGLALLAYDVYGLVTNNLRLLVLGRWGSSGSEGIFLYGLPVWVLFLAYLSLSIGLITIAVTGWMKNRNEALHAKIDKLGEKALVLALILYIGAVVLANKLNLHH